MRDMTSEVLFENVKKLEHQNDGTNDLRKSKKYTQISDGYTTLQQPDLNHSALTKQKTASTILLDMFTDWQNFASTSLGFLFTVGAVIVGVVAFITLLEFNLPFTGGMVLAGAVFGDIALGLIAGKLQKHGFFKCCGVGSKDEELKNAALTHGF